MRCSVIDLKTDDSFDLQSEEEIEYGLIVLWEMLENQALYIEGREGDIFSLLLQIRYSQKLNVSKSSCLLRLRLLTRFDYRFWRPPILSGTRLQLGLNPSMA